VRACPDGAARTLGAGVRSPSFRATDRPPRGSRLCLQLRRRFAPRGASLRSPGMLVESFRSSLRRDSQAQVASATACPLSTWMAVFGIGA
jgi:hypothetical protein